MAEIRKLGLLLLGSTEQFNLNTLMMLYYSVTEYRNVCGFGERVYCRGTGLGSGTNSFIILLPNYDSLTYRIIFKDPLCRKSKDHM